MKFRNTVCMFAIGIGIACQGLAADAPPRKAPGPPSTVATRLSTLETQAEAARAANRIDDAIALYKKGVALRPSWDDGWWALGTLYYELDQYRDAQLAFKRLAAINPEAGIAWGMLGLCEFQNAEYGESLKHIQGALNLHLNGDPAVMDVIRYHYALLLTRDGRFEESMRNLAIFAQRGLDAPEYVEAMGLAALRKPLLPKELPPGEQELVLLIGRAMFDASALKTAQAATEFKLAVQRFPKEPNVHYTYGSFLLFSDVDAGMAELQKELEITPTHVPALVTLASEYLKLHDFKKALPFAQQAVSADPGSFAAHAVLGRVEFEGGLDQPAGLKELETARQLEPTSPQVHSALASAYAKVGRKDDAAKERELFLDLRRRVDESQKALQ